MSAAVGFVTALRSASAAWPDELWAGSVGWADAILRSYYGVYEFTDDPACVLRVGLDQARAPVSLSDGTNVELGELVGTLHFWNEHLPRYSARGPDLGWACAVRDRVTYSLRAFSEAFNPAALPRQPFLRDRHELWISRATLLLRYARRNRQIAIGTARRRRA